MTDSNPVEESIKHSIRKNGFPEKIVRLPFKPVYDSCKNHGTSLTTVLKDLEKDKIFGKIQENHIEFRSQDKKDKPTGRACKEPENPPDFSKLKETMDNAEFQKTSQEYLSKINPEQLAEIRKTIENMSDAEKQNILKMFSKGFRPGPT